MKKQVTYKDLKKEMPIEDIVKNFDKRSTKLKELLKVITESSISELRKNIDYRILSAAIKEVQRISINDLNNETLALSTRNVLELNMIYQYTSLTEENLKEWIGNKAQDEIEILEGILKLVERPDTVEERIIKDRINTVRTKTLSKGYKISKQLSTKNLAQKVGLVKEYEGLYKLYSKFIHPTSYLINSSPAEVNSLQYKNIFLIQFQIYLSDLESRLRDFYDYKAD